MELGELRGHPKSAEGGLRLGSRVTLVCVTGGVGVVVDSLGVSITGGSPKVAVRGVVGV